MLCKGCYRIAIVFLAFSCGQAKTTSIRRVWTTDKLRQTFAILLTELINETPYSWALLGSLSKGIFEPDRQQQEVGFLPFRAILLHKYFGQIVLIKTLSNTNVVTSRHNKNAASLPVTLHRSKTIFLIYNWGGQENLVLCEKALPSDCYIQFGLLMTFFGSALGSSRRRPTPPNNVVAKKQSFPPICSKFNFVRGGRGGVAKFTNITENLTFIVLTKIFMQIEKIKNKNKTNWKKRATVFF